MTTTCYQGRAAAALLLAAAALATPAAAGAHEVLHEVARDRAIAVRAYESDGEALADVPFEVYAPADPATPWLKGRTDRRGWVAFVPDAAGAWRVKIVEPGGHGLELAIDAAPGPAPSSAAPAGAAALLLRPVAGLAAIAAVFGALFALYRRKARP